MSAYRRKGYGTEGQIPLDQLWHLNLRARVRVSSGRSHEGIGIHADPIHFGQRQSQAAFARGTPRWIHGRRK